MLEFVYYVGNREEKKLSKPKHDLAINYNYAIYLNCGPALRMFVPCDDFGEPLKCPQDIKDSFIVRSGNGEFLDQKAFHAYSLKYKQSEEECIFIGFTFNEEKGLLISSSVNIHVYNLKNITIEQLANSKDSYEMKQSFWNKLGLYGV